MKTYKLGTTGDRIVTVKKCGVDHIVTIRVKDDEKKTIELLPKRWATFRQNIDDITTNAKAVATGDEGIKLWQHIGGGHYVSVTSGYQCVDFRKWFQPYGSKDGEIKPTKKGVALRFDEWADLCTLVTTINTKYPSLDSALPCYYDDDHMNQVGWLNCTECHPFNDNLSQMPTIKMS